MMDASFPDASFRGLFKMADPQNLLIPVHADPLYPLPHLGERLARKGVVKIVAIGSSSTAGEGGIVPYPSRLQDALRNKYRNPLITVVNLGLGAQEARDELERMQDVIDEKPALTIWQVGTNAVWKGYNLDDVAAAIEEGLNLLKKKSMDVILMDLQYVPAVLTKDKSDATDQMQSLIAQRAAAVGVSVFRRFDMMRKLVDIEGRSFDALVDPGDIYRLHESDLVAQRIGYELCEVITAAAIEASQAAAPPA
jgi:GDSL-like Lipase/Acylhydrolase family